MVNVKEQLTSKQKIIAKVVNLENHISERIYSVSLRTWMSLGLTTVQLKSLFYIVRTKNANSKKLSDILGVTPANITGVIDRLIDRDMVQRVENKTDRRITLLKPTPKGSKLIASLDEHAIQDMSRFLATLNEDDLEHLQIGLSAYIKAWDIFYKDKKP